MINPTDFFLNLSIYFLTISLYLQLSFENYQGQLSKQIIKDYRHKSF